MFFLLEYSIATSALHFIMGKVVVSSVDTVSECFWHLFIAISFYSLHVRVYEHI